MNYNFDELIERRGTACYKWDACEHPEMIPMWVADMDFKTAPAVLDAMYKRMESGIFGYVKVPESYYSAIRRWFRLRHGWTILQDQILYTSGVVPALTVCIKALVKPGRGVIIQTPAFNYFFTSIRNNGCKLYENPLKRIDTPTGFTFELDFDGLRSLASREDVDMLILCNPHNPTGRVWSREELQKVADICRENNVTVVSDEIHCEVVHPGNEYTPYMTVDPDGIICCSPSKGFNIAGLQIANIMVRDEERRAKINRAININEVCDVNPFGVVALEAAYDKGGEWLDALNAYLYENYLYLRKTLTENLPALRMSDSEATYLAWVDISPLGISAAEVERIGKERGNVWMNAGEMYGGPGYIRINYACPRVRLEEGLRRFIETFKTPFNKKC